MTKAAARIQRIYLLLTFGNVFAASLIWGINTLFLLDAGLNNFEAFAANAFFTLGMVIFEVPTGVVADTWGRRASYLLGTITLAVTTFMYFMLWQVHAPFWEWAVVSILLGLGFTFFSGAVEAWLVDAMTESGYKDDFEAVFGKGQIASGAGMLVGSIGGGLIAQFSSLGVPFVVRALVLVLMFILAFMFMRDIGFTPEPKAKPLKAVKKVFDASIESGFRNPPVKWLMLAQPLSAGIGIYVFYAAQPFLLELYGDKTAYLIAGLAAAIIAGSQIAGGYLSPRVRKLPYSRIALIIFGTAISAVSLTLLGLVGNFVAALVLLVVWSLVFATVTPIRQAYINGLIPSKQRATVLSFDSLMSSGGGAVTQPLLGRSADVWSYGTSFVISAGIQALSIPFLAKSRLAHQKAANKAKN